MQIAKTNQLPGNTTSVISGTVQGPNTDVEKVFNPNFSEVLLMTGSSISFNLGPVTNCKYVALHGVYTNLKGNSVLLSVEVGGSPIDGSSSLWTLDDSTHTIMFVNESESFAGLTGDVIVTITNSLNPTSVWSFAYIAAGDVAYVPNSGVTGGQTYPYLQNNFLTRNTLNTDANPTGVILRRQDPSVNLSFRKIKNDWILDELKPVFDLYNEYGLVSMYDGVYEFESGNARRDWAWCAFGMSANTIKANSELNKLVDITLKFKAAF